MGRSLRHRRRRDTSGNGQGWIVAAVIAVGVLFGVVVHVCRDGEPEVRPTHHASEQQGAEIFEHSPKSKKQAESRVPEKPIYDVKEAPEAEQESPPEPTEDKTEEPQPTPVPEPMEPEAEPMEPEAEEPAVQEPPPAPEKEAAPIAQKAEARTEPKNVRMRWMQRSNSVYSVSEAATAGDMAVLQERLKEGDSVNVRNEYGNTPLHLAVMADHGEMVQFLLAAGADPMAENKAGKIPSALACSETVRRLCEKGEAPRRREIALAEQIRAGQGAGVAQALQEGVSPNALAADNKGSLLTLAVEAGMAEVVRQLLAAGADACYVRPDTRSVLTLAAGRGNVEILRMLLQAGADPMTHTGHGAYPIHDAIWSGRTAAAVELIPYYKKLNFNPDGKGNGYPVAMAIRRGNIEVVQAFIKAGMRVNDPMFSSEPLLVVAVKSNRPEIVRLLLKASANKNQKDASGKSAVDYARGELKELLR